MTRRGQAERLSVEEGESGNEVLNAKLLTSSAAVLFSVEEAQKRTTDEAEREVESSITFHLYLLLL
jgi:hypothetical protein